MDSTVTEYIIAGATIPLFDSSPTRTQAPSALHVRDGWIQWIGTPGEEDASLDRQRRSTVPVFDLGGKTLLPGFIDNHVHTLVTGDYAVHPNLHGMDAARIRDTVRELVESPGGESIVFAHGWDYPYWPFPHKRMLDEISSTRPIALIQFSGHAACVNSAMLEQLGIPPSAPGDANGTVERDENGEATGVLREDASRAIHQIRWKQLNGDRGTVETLIRGAQEAFARHGVTSVGDNTWYAGSAFGFTRLRERDTLITRVSCWTRRDLRRETAKMALASYDRYFVRRGAVKSFLDGAFSNYSAFLLEPYAGMPGHRGSAHLAGRRLQRIIGRLTRRGRQGAFHAIGDGAVREFLDAVETVSGRYARLRNLRHRLEHCQLVDGSDIERFARSGVLAAVQPHAISSPEKDERILGAERAARAYPYRTLLDAGVPLSFGSDSPAETTFAPLEGIRRAVLREGPERISVREAVDAYTRGSAFAVGSERWNGSIAAGKAADLVVLSDNPLVFDETGDAGRLHAVDVEATIMNGRRVFAGGRLADSTTPAERRHGRNRAYSPA